jgi:hypothetical protein
MGALSYSISHSATLSLDSWQFVTLLMLVRLCLSLFDLLSESCVVCNMYLLTVCSAVCVVLHVCIRISLLLSLICWYASYSRFVNIGVC